MFADKDGASSGGEDIDEEIILGVYAFEFPRCKRPKVEQPHPFVVVLSICCWVSLHEMKVNNQAWCLMGCF